jgi:hypothetical protein
MTEYYDHGEADDEDGARDTDSPRRIKISRDALLTALAAGAVVNAPRLFAIYGVHGDDDDLGAVRGWGMDFGDGEAVALYPDESAIHRSDSAERILRTNSLVADAHLVWLTEPALAEPA